MKKPKKEVAMYPTSSLFLFALAFYVISTGQVSVSTQELSTSYPAGWTNESSNTLSPVQLPKPIEDAITNSTAKRQKPTATGLINLNTHESSSSSTRNSFFDAMNREKALRDSNYLIDIANPSETNYFSSDSRLINHLRRPLLFQDNDYGVRAQLSSIPFTQAMSGYAQDSGGPQVFEAQTSYPQGSQLENSFYVNMIGTQPMNLMSQDRLPEEAGSSDYPNSQYANPTNEAYSPAIPHNSHPNYILADGTMAPQDLAKQAYIMSATNPSRLAPSDAKDQLARNKKILTNAQIVSLIDELKEFNARKLKGALEANPHILKRKPEDKRSSKSNRALSKLTESLRKSQKSQDNDSDDDGKKSNDEDQDSDDESERREDDARNEDDSGLRQEDLQRLASFIIEKEKENNRLLNAHRRNSPTDADDEDTDMKDTLLENSHRPQGSNKIHEPAESKKRAKDSSQILNILRKLSDKSRKMDRLKSDDDIEISSDNDDNEKARKRRANQDLSSSSDLPRGPFQNFTSPLLGLISDNLNRMQYPINMTQESSNSEENDAWQGKLKPHQVAKERPVTKRLGDVEQIHSSSSENQGEEESEYPKSERMKDLETLKQGLAKSREAQSKLSRIPMPLASLFRDALTNELTKVTDQTVVENSNSEEGKSNPKDEKLWQDEPENGEESNDSDLKLSRLEPENSSKEVKDQQMNYSFRDDYPISSTVNDRINKLSYNLDRYFNDGFFDKAENKSLPVNHQPKQQMESGPRTQAESSKKIVRVENQRSEPQADDDFDINVAIDGKRDAPELEEEITNSEISKGKVKNFPQELKSRSVRMRREKASSSKKAEKMKKQNQELPMKAGKTRRHAKNKEARKVTARFDPVDSETLDTPIGPDNSKSKVGGAQKTKGFKEKRSNYSRRNSEKFFQEPD